MIINMSLIFSSYFILSDVGDNSHFFLSTTMLWDFPHFCAEKMPVWERWWDCIIQETLSLYSVCQFTLGPKVSLKSTKWGVLWKCSSIFVTIKTSLPLRYQLWHFFIIHNKTLASICLTIVLKEALYGTLLLSWQRQLPRKQTSTKTARVGKNYFISVQKPFK